MDLHLSPSQLPAYLHGDLSAQEVQMWNRNDILMQLLRERCNPEWDKGSTVVWYSPLRALSNPVTMRLYLQI